MNTNDLPTQFQSIDDIEDAMSRPSPGLIEDLARVPGDILVLGVGGKMGPTLARMAKRADPQRRVIGVARFSQRGLRERLSAWGIECIEADLLSPEALQALPEAPNVVFMAGRKFGSSGSEWLTWAMNAHVPALVAQRWRRSRIVVFSTACVYPFAPLQGPGAQEDWPLTPPGEYANSCVARERMFEHFSHVHATPVCMVRLSYAIDMRYGVLHDIARKVQAGEAVDVGMAQANVIWQGDANDWALRCLAHCHTPPRAINVSGPRIRVRDVANALAERLGRPAVFTGNEAPTAWVLDCTQAHTLFGPPSVGIDRLLDWTADWVRRGGASLGKPTHFEARDGHY